MGFLNFLMVAKEKTLLLLKNKTISCDIKKLPTLSFFLKVPRYKKNTFNVSFNQRFFERLKPKT